MHAQLRAHTPRLSQARIGATTARSNTLCTRAAKNDASTPAAKEKDSKAPAAKVVEVKAVAKVGAPGVVYVGNGKFVKEDTKGVQSGTGKGDLGALIGMTGGWAGGEKALDAFRTELKAGPKEAVFTDPAEKKVVYNAKTGEVVDPDFSKDFNSMVGGWPGGEMGVAMFVDTGKVIENKKAPSVGWGPAVLALALAGALGYAVYLNDPLVEVTAADGTVQVVKSMAVKDSTPPPPLTAVAQKVAPYAAAAVGVGAGGLLLTVAAKKGLAQAGQVAAKGGRVAALGLAAGAVATHILGLW